MLQLKRAVDAEWRAKVPLTRILEHDTTVALTAWLDDNVEHTTEQAGAHGGGGKGGGKAQPNVVCLNGLGSGVPFFCVAPVSDQPFFALQSRHQRGRADRSLGRGGGGGAARATARGGCAAAARPQVIPPWAAGRWAESSRSRWRSSCAAPAGPARASSY